MRIIPAIDVIEGQCVRLTQGDYDQKKVYHTDPLEVAKEFEDQGITYLHLVDLDGARQGKVVNWKVLESICNNTSLAVDFGGGLKSDQEARTAFACGARQITGGSIAVKNPEQFVHWVQEFGSEKIILGADVKEKLIAISGWKKITDIQLNDFLRDYQQKGVKHIICTDIQKDGVLQGPSLALYGEILEQFPDLHLIASGGISSPQDLEQLKKIGCHGAIIGKALYENKISWEDLAPFLN